MNIFILGCGLSGQEVSKLALKKKYTVYTFDENKNVILDKSLINNKDFYFYHPNNFFSSATPQIIIASPGIAPDSNLIKFAESFTCPIISEIEFADQFNHRPIIAVTGTNGKSTTVEMIVYLLKQIGKKAIALGNYGIPYSQFIHQHTEYEIGVVELSSFQLEKTYSFNPQVAILTNLSSDHQNRYSSFQQYINTKLKLFDFLPNSNVIIADQCHKYYSPNQELTYQQNYFGQHKECFIEIKDKTLFYKNKQILSFDETQLTGLHNYYNAAAAIASLIKLNLPLTDFPLQGFSLADHRQEIIHTKPLIINDSKSTNPHALKVALENFISPNKKIRLIAGGKDKKMDFSLVNNLLGNYVSNVYLYGESKNILKNCWSNLTKCDTFNNFELMIKQALTDLHEDETLLFSPACTSFDLFENYQERGKKFKIIIEKWQK